MATPTKRDKNKKISAAKLKANQQNAQHSTGPVTPQGKLRSALNSTKWGMTTTVAVLPSEDRMEYLRFSKGMYYTFFPVSTEEESLTLEMTNHTWRLRRCADLEVSIYDKNLSTDDTLKELNKLSLHETRITRNREKTRAMLRDSQKERNQNQANDEAFQILDGDFYRLDRQLRMMGFEPGASALAQSIQEQMNIEIAEDNANILARRSVDQELQDRLAAKQAEQAGETAELKAAALAQMLEYKREAEAMALKVGFVFTPPEEAPADPRATAETPPQ